MSEPDYDVAVIGAGQAGVPLAHRLASTGRGTVLFEREHLGGSCVNFGCTPTKAALESARVAHAARGSRAYGIDIEGVEVDFPSVLERARDLAMEGRKSIEDGFEEEGGPELVHNHARLDGREGELFRLRVGGATLTARQVVLDTGARSRIPPIDGLEAADFLTAENWLHRPELPESLVVLGGGYIGLEMAQFYRRMGSEVTVLEATGEVTGQEDDDVARTLRRCLADEGVEFLLETRAARIDGEGDGLRLELEGDRGAPSEIAADELFVAVGRQPNTDDIGLDTVGVELDDDGFVEVDERLATSVEGVWAAGDIRGGPMFTHTSWDDHRVLLSQLDGDGSRTAERIVPYAIFTDPELGRVGLTERAARDRGHEIRVATMEMAGNGKAREIGRTEGFVKVVVEAESGRILGAAVLAAHGSELVHEYLDVMAAGAPYSVIRDAVHIHPTLSEALHSVLDSLDGDGSS